MKLMLKNIFWFSFLCLSLGIQAQDRLAIGQWKTHLPSLRATSVSQSEDNIYFATEFSVLVLDKAELSTSYLDKVNGLSDTGIRFLKYDEAKKLLLVVYNNSNIDLVTPDGVINIDAIKRKQDILGDKNVYDAFFDEDAVFLSCGFGLVKLRLTDYLIESTTFTNVKVNSFTSYDGRYFLASDEGIYSIPSSGLNILDFGQWDFWGQAEGLEDDYTARYILPYKDDLYFNYNDSLYRYDGNDFEYIFHEDGYYPNYLVEGEEKLIGGFYCVSDCQGKVNYFLDDTSVRAAASDCIARPLGAIQDQYNRIWFADEFNQFRVEDLTNGCAKLEFGGPGLGIAFDLSVYKDELWVAGGGVTGIWNNLFNRTGFVSNINGQWDIYNESNTGALNNRLDHVGVTHDPRNGDVYIASFFGGLIKYDRTNFEVYDETNSTLEDNSGSPARVGGLAFDQEYNLWMSNHSSSKPIAVLKNDGTWKSFSNIPNSLLTRVAIDLDGNKWLASSGGNGLVVFNEGDDFDGNQDDEVRLINTGNSELSNNTVNAIAVDLEGDVWIGTAQGATVFECGSTVFDASRCVGNNRVVVRADGNNELLLASENIRAIAIDGANRKWFGTTNGIFVQSSDGREEVFHFNENNSPLLDNEILSLEINQETGEVFIGTTRGLIAYQSNATVGEETRHLAQVTAFPNPVRPEYEGTIAVRGLPRDANVKITDINGVLVFETKALGGQVVWDGRDYNGRKARTGVYLVFSTSDATFNEPDALVTKILIVD